MKITKSQLKEIIREEIKALKESARKPERGDIGYLKSQDSPVTVYDVLDNGKRLKIKVGKTGKTIVVDRGEVKILADL
jgi:hypothetical protein